MFLCSHDYYYYYYYWLLRWAPCAITWKRASPLATAKPRNCFCCLTFYNYFVLIVVKIHSFVRRPRVFCFFCRLRDVLRPSNHRRPRVFVCVTPHLFDFFDIVPNLFAWPWPAEVHSATLTTAGISWYYNCRTHDTTFDGRPLIIRTHYRRRSLPCFPVPKPRIDPNGLRVAAERFLTTHSVDGIHRLVSRCSTHDVSSISYCYVGSPRLTKTKKFLSTISNHQILCLPNITIFNLFHKNN